MATKQSKRSSTKSSSFISSGGEGSTSSSFSSPGRKNRPPSPSRLSRMQEQEELQGLNDRLAAYIDKVRSLEAENSRLSLQVRTTEEVVRREVTSVKTLYETELAELRKLLDDTSKEKTRLQLEVDSYRSDYDELLGKYNNRDREASRLEARVRALEKQADFEKENQKLKAEVAKLEAQLAKSRKQVEDETVLRIDLENRLKTLKEDLHFKSRVYEQELEESRIRTTSQLEEADGRIEQEYEARLQDALREIRAQHDDDLQSVKADLESLYDNKIEDLRAQVARSSSSSSAAWDELTLARATIDGLQSDLNRQKAEYAGYEARISDLEKQLARERDDFRHRLAQKDQEISGLRVQLEELEIEYANLLEVKVKLDREIEAYRKLLESEETRLNLSASESMTTSTSGAKKRRRVDIGEAVEEYTQRSMDTGYKREAASTCGIEVTEVDTDGKFIKLTNSTDKDIHLSHWQLKHQAGGNETVHTFARNVLKAGQSVTVWSSDSDTTHNPPTDLVMKGKRWFAGGDMKTALINADEEEVSTCSMTKSMRSVTQLSTRRSGPRGSGADELQDKDKCFIM